MKERSFKVNNTIYQRSKKYGVGKEMAGKIYIHKKYIYRIISPKLLRRAMSCLPQGFKFNCLMINKNKNIIRFDQSPEFDTVMEPSTGDFVSVDLSTMKARRGHSDSIWHHKWMWVDDDYDGFDVDASYLWSKQWTQFIQSPSGSKKIWMQQLSRAGLIKI